MREVEGMSNPMKKCMIGKTCNLSCLNTKSSLSHPCSSFSTTSYQNSRAFMKNDCPSSVCKKCHKECKNKLNFFCGDCHYLKDPEVLDSVNYFELFDLDTNFDIDLEKLDKNFYKLQHMFHPDRYVSASDQDLVDTSTAYSSFINNGYKLLKDDLERAKYMLEKRGYKVLAEDENLTDMTLLEQIMETREQIEFANTPQDLEIHKDLAKAAKAKLVKKISRLFAAEKYDAVKDQLVKLKYHNRILEAIDEKEREFM